MKLLKNKYFSFSIRILITILLFVWIFKKIDINLMIETLKNLPLYSILGVLFSVFMVIVLCILRWNYLLKSIGKIVGWKQLTVSYWIGFFMNNFLPASVGMDIVRSAYISEGVKETASIIGTTIVERLLGFVGIFVFTFIGVAVLFILGSSVPYISYAFYFSIGGVVFFFFFFYILYHPKVFSLIERMLDKIKLFNIGELLNTIYKSFVFYKDDFKVVLINIFISTIIQGTLVFGIYAIGRGLGLDIPISPYFVYVPIIMILSTLPLTINGMGIRELSFIYLFGLSGVGKEEAVLMSLILFFATILVSLPGGILILMKRNKH